MTDPACELIVVMPVYNEQDCIEAVIRSWSEALSRETESFEIVALNDGSTDDTLARLNAVAATDARLTVIDKTNEGHGPTLLRGYANAVQRSAWTFQVDSDDELPASSFASFWERRSEHDFMVGVRSGREQGLGRRIISMCSRGVVRCFAGTGVEDVNAPYRLMRSEILADLLAGVPPDTFAPNVALSGLAIKAGCRILNIPVPHRNRQTGVQSLIKFKLVKAALKSFAQTARVLSGRVHS